MTLPRTLCTVTRLLAPVLALALVLTLAGCGSIPPPAPSGESSPRFGSGGFDPEELLRLIELSYNQTDRMAYERCLADTFSFEPYAAVAMDYPRQDLSHWDLEREIDFIRRLFTPGRKIVLTLPVSIRHRGIPANNHAVWEVDYLVRVDDSDFAGAAILGMVRFEKNWYLESWADVTETAVGGRQVETSGALRAQHTR